MNNKQFAGAIAAFIITVIALSAGLALQNGIYEYKSFQSFARGGLGTDTFIFIRFNKFTGDALTMVATSKGGYRFVDIAKTSEQEARKKVPKIILPE